MIKAMILAAGFGKRLLPLTNDCPKPLLKIGEETLLLNTINFLKKFGIKKIVINVHYLGDQIIEYLKKKNFNLEIVVVNEKEKILDTGGGILNAINHFNESILCINPDTIWNLNYLNELKKMQSDFFSNNYKCTMLVVNKTKSFDKNLKGDFNLENNLLNKNGNNLKYIYTGLQILKSDVFSDIDKKVFSINEIWEKLIKKRELVGVESNIKFLHVSNLDTYNKLNVK